MEDAGDRWLQSKTSCWSKRSKKVFSSRYFTVILTVGSLVLTGLVGGLFEYLGGQLAQMLQLLPIHSINGVFTEWRNRPEFIKLRAEYAAKAGHSVFGTSATG